jgi:hypothetical protein
MTMISCRQCGHRSSRSDFPRGHYKCPACDWSEMLPPMTKVAKGRAKTKAKAKAAEPVDEGAVAVADAPPEEELPEEFPDEPVDDAPDDAAPEPDDAMTDEELAAALPDFLAMTDEEFLSWCAGFLCNFGYAVSIAETEERDSDLELTRDGGTVFVDCRRTDDDAPVRRAACQKLVGAMAGRGARHGMILTTGGFTDGSREYAAGLDHIRLELVDRDDLVATIDAILRGPLRKWWA